MDFSHIKNSIHYHIASEEYGMNLPPEAYGVEAMKYVKTANKPKILILFNEPSDNDYWMTNLKENNKWIGKYIISDVNLYLSGNAQECHSLFLVSSEAATDLEALLGKRGIYIPGFSVPQLVHKFRYANMYKMSITKDCSRIFPR